jgi:hypothetical protein
MSTLRLIAAGLTSLLFFYVTLAGAPQPGPAGVLLPRTPGQTISIAASGGDTYLNAARTAGGLFAKVETDAATPVRIASGDAIAALIDQFDPTVAKNLYGEFTNGKADFKAIVSHAQGQSLLPQQVRTTLQPFITHLSNASGATPALARVSDLSLLASYSGTLVVIDANNYFYNVAYQSPIVQSGRSYGVGQGRRLLDQSDAGYLRELDAYLKAASAGEVSGFYRDIVQLLAQSSSGGLSGLTSAGQVVTTDFLTVYTAELIRHNMVGLNVAKDPWEIDIGEITFLTDYGAAVGQVMVNGHLVPGTADVYGKKAIGDTRLDFTKLARGITAFERSRHPDLIASIIQLTDIQDQALLNLVGDDVFRRVFVYLNRPEYQAKLKATSGPLIDAIVALLSQVRMDGSQITTYLKSN